MSRARAAPSTTTGRTRERTMASAYWDTEARTHLWAIRARPEDRAAAGSRAIMSTCHLSLGPDKE